MTRSVHRRHHDIADDLRHQITTGSIKPGERLPSEAGLAARYRVSTVTLRRALAVLQGEGLVEKIHGKGNYVRHPRRKVMYVGGWGTLDPWTAAEPTLRITVRSTTVPASVHLPTLLKVPTGSPLAEYTCLSLEQGSPHGLARIYIPRDLAPAVPLPESPADAPGSAGRRPDGRGRTLAGRARPGLHHQVRHSDRAGEPHPNVRAPGSPCRPPGHPAPEPGTRAARSWSPSRSTRRSLSGSFGAHRSP